MGLLALFNQWIVEHGSAIVQEKHLALFRDQLIAADKKARVLELENANLNAAVEQLTVNNEQLRQKIQRRNDVIQKEKFHNNLLKDTKMQWGCIMFTGDNKLYCPSCFHKTGKKIETSRVNTHNRYCAVCKTTLPSG